MPLERAVVTGGAQGIGREIVLGLARRRVSVVVADVDLEGASRTADEACRLGASATALRCDVRDPHAVDRLADEAGERMGGVDLLVNNAGVLVVGELADLAADDCRRVIDINLWGVIHGCRAFVPRMRARGAGAILNVASLSAWLTLPQMGIYSATKAAVVALSETLHAELAASGVTVTVLCPSFTRTHLIGASSGTTDSTTMRLAESVMHHLGEAPASVAELGLRAVIRGDLYAIPTLHGQLAWRAKRLFPKQIQWALGLASERLQPSPSRKGKAAARKSSGASTWAK